MIDIRPYDPAASGPLLDLVRELQDYEATLYELMKPASEIGPWYLELLEEYCRKDDGTILVAWEAAQAVGYATIFVKVVEDGSGDEVPHTYAYVGDLVVAASARGRGIARQLLDECEKHARRAGRNEMRITVLARNNRARDVYGAFGFEDLHVDMRKRLIP